MTTLTDYGTIGNSDPTRIADPDNTLHGCPDCRCPNDPLPVDVHPADLIADALELLTDADNWTPGDAGAGVIARDAYGFATTPKVDDNHYDPSVRWTIRGALIACAGAYHAGGPAMPAHPDLTDAIAGAINHIGASIPARSPDRNLDRWNETASHRQVVATLKRALKSAV